MKTLRSFVTSVAMLALPALVYAQAETRHEAGTAEATTSKITGQVLYVEGNSLVVRMTPAGDIRTFNVPPGRKFIIDGQAKTIGDLQPGTVLTATVTTKTHDVRVRTQSVVTGTVWYVQGNSVILTLENGENRQYNVPASFQFTVDDKPVTVKDLKKGTKVVGSKMVEEPETVITTDVTVTGKAAPPK